MHDYLLFFTGTYTASGDDHFDSESQNAHTLCRA